MSTPNFLAPQTNPFNLADVGDYITPTFADLDNDGDLDAFVGESEGNIVYFKNTGSVGNPSFAAPVYNPFNLADVGIESKPAFADLDNDGDLDAFVGEWGGDIVYFKNTGSVGNPSFAAP
ncbi:FG-GAP repeat domain-containing protein, partial [Dapis sp. BLCC M172]|uniref:FG-GAP repeat domain-containing protein n=1 Tax=Dapis sp. BLCC M172 TaxID=2975281 RepID=UPI003CEAF6BF